jgi:hypothetical protein
MVCHFCATSISCCLIKGSRVCSARSSHSSALARYSSAYLSPQSSPSVRHVTKVAHEESFRQIRTVQKSIRTEASKLGQYRNSLHGESSRSRHISTKRRESLGGSCHSREVGPGFVRTNDSQVANNEIERLSAESRRVPLQIMVLGETTSTTLAAPLLN